MLVDGFDDTLNIERAKAGDLQAFDLIVKRYAEQVYRIGLRMTNNRDDAEDIQQETFLRVYRHLHRFRSDSSFSTWLSSIAVNVCLTHRQKAAQHPTVQLVDDWEAHADVEQTVEHELLAGAEADRVQRILSLLAPQDRVVLILKYVEGFSHEEIAATLNCSSGSCRSRLHRAKKLFQEHFLKGNSE